MEPSPWGNFDPDSEEIFVGEVAVGDGSRR